MAPVDNVPNDNPKPVVMPDPGMMSYHPQNHSHIANMRRYQPPMDPTHMQMFQAPHAIYSTQNPCYSCLTTVPMAGIQNRYAR